jgi:F0F1-type ATP synthase membrane subunit c/vacuolar-type H+-ATPase subunit K
MSERATGWFLVGVGIALGVSCAYAGIEQNNALAAAIGGLLLVCAAVLVVEMRH